MSEENVQHRSAFERHAQTIVQVIIAALCIWMAKTTTETATEVAVQSERLVSLSTQVDTLQESTRDRYMGTDARRDLAVRDAQINDLVQRVRALEQGN